jgi:hypothetical protein
LKQKQPSGHGGPSGGNHFREYGVRIRIGDGVDLLAGNDVARRRNDDTEGRDYEDRDNATRHA